MYAPQRPACGFTLIEVLIAVGIFALIGIVAAALLGRTLEARAEMQARADRLQAVQRGLQRLQRDVLQYADRPVRDEFGDPQAALVLGLDGALELTVQGWRNPLQLPRSELQRVRWHLTEDGVLERTFWSVLDRAQDSPARTQAVLADVVAFDVEVIDGEGGSWRDWPRDAASLGEISSPLPQDAESGQASGDVHPIALRLAVDVPPLGRVERLLLLGEAIELDVNNREQGASGAGATPPQEEPGDNG